MKSALLVVAGAIGMFLLSSLLFLLSYCSELICSPDFVQFLGSFCLFVDLIFLFVCGLIFCLFVD
jgi:hypothetical protein